MVNKWMQEEIDYLKQNSYCKSCNELASDLNRTYVSVSQKLFKLKIKPKKQTNSKKSKWTNDEIKYLHDNAEHKTYKELSNELHRPKLSIERKMNRLQIKPGFRYSIVWIPDKIRYLKDNKGNRTYYELSTDLSMTYRSIRKEMKKLHLKPKQHEKYKTVNHNFFKTWSEEMAYIFGYWFADGNIGSRGKHQFNSDFTFSISSKDIDILERFKTIMQSTYPIRHSKKEMNGKTFYCHSVTIHSKEIYNDIISLGGCERKSLVAKFPTIPEQYVRHFIRGYFDGDGSIRYRNNNLKYYPNANFLGISEFLSSMMNYLPHKTKITRGKNAKIYRIDYSGENAQKVLQLMYEDSNIYLQRKYDRYLNVTQWQRKRNPWTKNELQILNEKYPTNGVEIPELLETHPYGSISIKSYQLGIGKI